MRLALIKLMLKVLTSKEAIALIVYIIDKYVRTDDIGTAKIKVGEAMLAKRTQFFKFED